MANYCELIGERARIKIEALDYENPVSTDIDDANWISCNVSISIGPFSGTYAAAFTTFDFSQFLNELQKVCDDAKGEASFMSHEEALSLKVTLNSLGKPRISGNVKIIEAVKIDFSFSFDGDLSSLDVFRKQLADITKKFPIKKE